MKAESKSKNSTSTMSFLKRKVKLTLAQTGGKDKVQHTKEKLDFEDAWKVLAPSLKQLESKDDSSVDLLNEAEGVRTNAESSKDYAKGLTELEKTSQKVTTRLEELKNGKEKYDTKAIEALKLRMPLPPEVPVPQGDSKITKAKAQKAEQYNSRMKAAGKAFTQAEILADQNDYTKALTSIDDVINEYQALKDQFQEIIAEQTRRAQEIGKMIAFKACRELHSSIDLLRDQVARAYGVEDRVIAQLSKSPSDAETDFVERQLEFTENSKGSEGFDDVVNQYEQIFNGLWTRLQKVQEEYKKYLKDAPSKPPKKGTAKLPKELATVVEKATQSADEKDKNDAAREELKKARTEWESQYARAADHLRLLTSLGNDDKIKQIHTLRKKEYDKLPNLAAKEGATKAEFEDGTKKLKFLIQAIDGSLDSIQDVRAERRKKLRETYKALKKLIENTRPNVLKFWADKKDLFEQLNKERQSLKSIMDSSVNEQALDYVEHELTSLTSAVESFAKGEEGSKQYQEMKDKLAALKTVIDDEPLKALKQTHKQLKADYNKLEKDFQKNGPAHPSVATPYTELKKRADDAHASALEVKAKQEIFTADYERTKEMFDELSSKIEEAAKKAGGTFDTKQMREKLKEIKASRDGSELLSDYDAMLSELRLFRTELRAAEGGDFTKILATAGKHSKEEEKKKKAEENFKANLKDFEDHLFVKARGTLENIGERVLSKLHMQEREQRVKILVQLLEQTEKVAQGEDWEAAQNQLDAAIKYADDIIKFPEGSQPPGKEDFQKLGENWKKAVTFLHQRLDKLAEEIGKAGGEIVKEDDTRPKFDTTADKAKKAFEELKEGFTPDAFKRALATLELGNPDKMKAAKEEALRIMRQHRRQLRDPLFAKLRENPFLGVNVKQVIFALDAIDEIVQQA